MDLEELDKKGKQALIDSVALAGARRGKGRAMEQRDPAKCVEALERVASGESARQVAKDVGMDLGALCALRIRHAEALGMRREVLAQDAMGLAEKARVLQHEKLERLFDNPEELAKTNIRDLAMSYGIYADKFHMATEGNRMVIEHKGAAPSIEDARRVIEEARAKLKAQAVEVNVTPGNAA